MGISSNMSNTNNAEVGNELALLIIIKVLPHSPCNWKVMCNVGLVYQLHELLVVG